MPLREVGGNNNNTSATPNTSQQLSYDEFSDDCAEEERNVFVKLNFSSTNTSNPQLLSPNNTGNSNNRLDATTTLDTIDLSPESSRKRQFCTYLKLHNHDAIDKTTATASTTSRKKSMRIKHFNELLLIKQQENRKKIEQALEENGRDDCNSSPTITTIRMPLPPSRYYQDVSHFELSTDLHDIIKENERRRWPRPPPSIITAKKTDLIKCNNNQASSSSNNKCSKVKYNIRRRRGNNRLSLRSQKKLKHVALSKLLLKRHLIRRKKTLFINRRNNNNNNNNNSNKKILAATSSSSKSSPLAASSPLREPDSEGDLIIVIDDDNNKNNNTTILDDDDDGNDVPTDNHHFQDDDIDSVSSSSSSSCQSSSESMADYDDDVISGSSINQKTDSIIINPAAIEKNVERTSSSLLIDDDDDDDNYPHQITTTTTLIEHDYASSIDNDNQSETIYETIPPSLMITTNNDDDNDVVSSLSPLLFDNNETKITSLHRTLLLGASNQKQRLNNNGCNNIITKTSTGWHTTNNNLSTKNLSHPIHICRDNGAILTAFYVAHNLILVQECVVSFWTQSALGNILGAQNMWIPNGNVQRLVLNSKCIRKEATKEVVFSIDNGDVAYIELWTKEHKSDFREGPVTDVFVRIYYWLQRQNRADKKVLQLDNIKGFPDHVQYIVLKYYPKIIVSWYSKVDDKSITHIRAYQLAMDYQTVSNVSAFKSINHYISSLHNIEDCANMIMGCGEDKVTLWNIDHGYIVATIELSGGSIERSLSTYWVKCERGYLFTVQESIDHDLRLIAINGMNKSWKKLHNYVPTKGFKLLRNVFLSNGILVAFYHEGILCWNADTGQLLFEEEVPLDCLYIASNQYIVIVVNDQVIVRHSMSHFIDS